MRFLRIYYCSMMRTDHGSRITEAFDNSSMWCYQPMSRGSWGRLVTCVRCGASPLLSPRPSPSPPLPSPLPPALSPRGLPHQTLTSLHSALQVQDKKTSAVTRGQAPSLGLGTPYRSLPISSIPRFHALVHTMRTHFRTGERATKWAGGTSQLCYT